MYSLFDYSYFISYSMHNEKLVAVFKFDEIIKMDLQKLSCYAYVVNDLNMSTNS